MSNETPYDVIVVGGSYAGLSAALQVARTRRRVAVIDAGVRRNRFAAASQGFLGQDGRPPGDIVADARAQLLAYPTVTWLQGTAAHAAEADGVFRVAMATGEVHAAKRVVLATGVVDQLPDIPGLEAHWGRHVFLCPYCHGYELDNGRIGVIAVSPLAIHQATLLPDWGRVTLFTNGAMALDEAQTADLTARGVVIEPEPVAEIVGDTPTVRLRDGREVPMDGLFTASHYRLASPLAAQLGCAVDEGPMGPVIRTDELKATSVPGVFACGDAARAMHSVALAVGDGALAGIGAHRSLIFG
jgi:thioredoxin reductase